MVLEKEHKADSKGDPILAATDLPKHEMFWEIWGLQKLFNQILVLGQSRTKTSTKTHLAKSSNTYPKDRLLTKPTYDEHKKHDKKFW